MAFDDPEWLSETSDALEHLSVVDAADRLLFVNHPQPALGKYVGRPVFDFIKPEHHDPTRRAIERARASGVPQHYESVAVNTLGTTSYFSNWVFGLDAAGGPGALGFITTDVTARRQAVDALELSESTLRSLVDHAPDFIMIVDRDRRVQFVNRLEHGFRLDEVLGSYAETFVPPDYRDTVIEAIAHVFEHATPTSYDTALQTPEGVQYFETRLGPIILDDKVTRVSLVSTNITSRLQTESDQKRLAAQLQQAQKMDALGQLTGGVAHDFNNLLMAIGGNLELVQLEQQLGERPAVYLAAAIRAVESAAELTRRLLVFSRTHQLEATVTNTNDIVRGMLTILRRTLGESIEVEAALADDLWLCDVDHGQLEQTILNLAVNARDAMPSGGRLVITTANVEIGAEAGPGAAPSPSRSPSPGEYVELTVTDDGDGMSADVAAQAFQPFYTTKDVGKGTGLGLSTVYGFVTKSGGQVTIDSTPGHGTCVRVLLPRCLDRGVVAVEPPAEELQMSRCGEVVLVVEDKREVQMLSAQMLERLGYRVLTASDGAEALALVAAHSDIAAVFTDVGLPGALNGFEVAEELAVRRPSLPVVFTSGYPEAARADAAVEGKLLLRKPFTLHDLGASLRQVLTPGDAPS